MIGGGSWARQNKILKGTYVKFVSEPKINIVKKDPETPVEDFTSAVLDKAILGKMILGKGGL